MRGAPLDPLQALRELEIARDREEIFDLVVRATRKRAPFVALFTVHPEDLRARELERHIPRNAVPAFETAIATRAAAVAPLATGDLFVDGMLDGLVGPTGLALILPIAVGARTLALVVAHRDDTTGISDLTPLVAASNLALARVQAGRARTAKPVRASTAGYEVEISFDDGVMARRAALGRNRQLEAWAPLAETIRELVHDGVTTGDPDEDEQLELLIELGRIHADRLGELDLAIDAWQSAQTIDAGDPRVLDALEGAFAKRERWHDCVDLLERRAALSQDLAVLERLAALAAQHDPDRAIEAHKRILEREPARDTTPLEALYRSRAAWQPLATLLLDRARIAEDPIAVLEAVARMYELEAGDPQAAYLVWLAIARREPEHPRIVDELERLAIDDLETGPLASELEAEHPGVASALWRVLGDRARGAEAIAYYERARRCDPGSAPALVALHRAYLATAAWPALAELMPSLIDALAPTAPVAVVVALHVELGEMLVDRLDRPDDAVRAFTDALALDDRGLPSGGSAEGRRGVVDASHAVAFAGLMRAHRATGNTEALLDATEAAIDLASPAEQIARYADIASAWHDHGRFDRAAACWHKLRVLDPPRAHAGLVRALEAGEDWPALADALRAQGDRVALLAVLERRLDDAEGALAIARELDHPAALDVLARLGAPPVALAALQKLLARTPGDPDLLQRIGQAHLDARDATAARAALVEAIALDPRNARAREGMARVHLQQGELVAAGDELLRAAQLSTKPEAIRCLADAAWLYRHRLDDAERARTCLQQILKVEPEHADAKHALAELLHDAQEWEALWPHLEQQVRAPDASLDLLTKAARCASELGKLTIASELFDRACERGAPIATQIERASALYRAKSLDAAAAAYQAIATTDRAQQLGVYRRLAQINTELARPVQAQAFHLKVLDLDPLHRETLSEVAELQLARGRFDDAIASLRGLAAATIPAAERVALLERIGDLYRHQLASSGRAASAYLEALELDGGNRRILQRLLDLQTETGQWRLAVGTIERFLERETEPAKRGAYFLAAAEIRRTELKDQQGALDCYESGIDELFRERPLRTAARARALDAFHAVERRAIADQSWKYLEQSYRRMIARLPDGDPLAVAMWDELGEVYRLRLESPQSAIQAFEAAHALDPDKSARRRRILGELYEQLGTVRPPSANEATVIESVVEQPRQEDPEAWRALAVASIAEGRLDEAWCVCRALVFGKLATAKETEFYRRYQSHEIKKAPGIIDEETWAMIRHPDEDRVISAIFALVWENLAALRAGTPRSFELAPKDRIPVETDQRVVAKIFRHASRVLNLPLRDVYAQPRRSGRLLLANCIEKGRLAPAVIVGRDLMTGYRDTEIAAAVGAMVALTRPGYYLRLTLPTLEELEAALVAAVRLVGRAIGRAALAPLVEVFVPKLQKVLTRPIAETLLAFSNHLPDQPDLARWRNAVDATSHRAGLVVSGELLASARMIASEATPFGGIRPSERVADLVAYSVSPGYFALRRHLGIALQPPTTTTLRT